MSELGAVHFVFSLAAIGAGAWVLLIRKGTRWHRSVGHLYAMSMIGVNVSALFLYRMTGRFGPFHLFAIIALLTLMMAMYSVLARRPKKNWLEAHAIWMSWSYIGLLAAAVSETATRLLMPILEPQLRGAGMTTFWVTVGVATLVVVGTGQQLVKRRLPQSIAATPAAMRKERAELEALTQA